MAFQTTEVHCGCCANFSETKERYMFEQNNNNHVPDEMEDTEVSA